MLTHAICTYLTSVIIYGIILTYRPDMKERQEGKTGRKEGK